MNNMTRDSLAERRKKHKQAIICRIQRPHNSYVKLKSTTCEHIHKKQLCQRIFSGLDGCCWCCAAVVVVVAAAAVESLPFHFVGYSSYSGIRHSHLISCLCPISTSRVNLLHFSYYYGHSIATPHTFYFLPEPNHFNK